MHLREMRLGPSINGICPHFAIRSVAPTARVALCGASPREYRGEMLWLLPEELALILLQLHPHILVGLNYVSADFLPKTLEPGRAGIASPVCWHVQTQLRCSLSTGVAPRLPPRCFRLVLHTDSADAGLWIEPHAHCQ